VSELCVVGLMFERFHGWHGTTTCPCVLSRVSNACLLDHAVSPQMLSFALSSAPSLTWATMGSTQQLTKVLALFSTVDPGMNLVFPMFVASTVWVAALLCLTGVVASSFYKSRHASTFPVQVRTAHTTGSPYL
jgi:hypothetical protein